MKIIQVILALSILIVIHEAGHFCFAKLFRIRVEKFYLFFDAGGFSLLSTKRGWFSRLFPGLKRLETEYGIGWLPLGGYCKISGMVDESMDLGTLAKEPKPWEFRTRPAWQRLLVMAGGVLFNFLLAIALFCSILGIWGESYLPAESTRLYAGELAQDLGFRSGDRILSLDGRVPEDFSTIQADLVRRDVARVDVLRGKDTVVLYMDRSRTGDMLSEALFDVAVPFVIDSLSPTSPNLGAGLRRGDRFLTLEGEPAGFVQDSHRILSGHRGETVQATLVRDGDTLALSLQTDSLGMLGIRPMMPEIRHRDYGFFASLPAGLRLTGRTLRGYLQDLRIVATPKTGAYKSVGSFIAIGQAFPSAWNIQVFLRMLALLSVMLGVMNLLPIPALDGGHILFTLYEMITGRKPGERFLIVAQMIGMVLLLLLMMLAFGNDIGRLLR